MAADDPDSIVVLLGHCAGTVDFQGKVGLPGPAVGLEIVLVDMVEALAATAPIIVASCNRIRVIDFHPAYSIFKLNRTILLLNPKCQVRLWQFLR